MVGTRSTPGKSTTTATKEEEETEKEVQDGEEREIVSRTNDAEGGRTDEGRNDTDGNDDDADGSDEKNKDDADHVTSDVLGEDLNHEDEEEEEEEKEASSTRLSNVRNAALEDEKDDKAEDVDVKDLKNKYRIFVAKIPHSSSQESVQSYFESYGTIIDFYIQKSKGFGFISFKTEDALNKVLSACPHEFQGTTLVVDRAKVARDDAKKASRGGRRGGPKKLFVGRLDLATTAEDLKTFFADFGSVVDAYVPMKKDGSGESRGFGFVTFESDEVVRSLMAKRDSLRIQERDVILDFAASRDDDRNGYGGDRRPVGRFGGNRYGGGFGGRHDDYGYRGYDRYQRGPPYYPSPYDHPHRYPPYDRPPNNHRGQRGFPDDYRRPPPYQMRSNQYSHDPYRRDGGNRYASSHERRGDFRDTHRSPTARSDNAYSSYAPSSSTHSQYGTSNAGYNNAASSYYQGQSPSNHRPQQLSPPMQQSSRGGYSTGVKRQRGVEGGYSSSPSFHQPPSQRQDTGSTHGAYGQQRQYPSQGAPQQVHHTSQYQYNPSSF